MEAPDDELEESNEVLRVRRLALFAPIAAAAARGETLRVDAARGLRCAVVGVTGDGGSGLAVGPL